MDRIWGEKKKKNMKKNTVNRYKAPEAVACVCCFRWNRLTKPLKAFRYLNCFQASKQIHSGYITFTIVIIIALMIPGNIQHSHLKVEWSGMEFSWRQRLYFFNIQTFVCHSIWISHILLRTTQFNNSSCYWIMLFSLYSPIARMDFQLNSNTFTSERTNERTRTNKHFEWRNKNHLC